MKKLVTSAIALSVLAGCATSQNGGYGSSWEPVVDVRPHQAASYPTDLMECQAHADKVWKAHEAAIGGAIAGALLGAALGAAAGGGSRLNARMAGVGAVAGGTSAAAAAEGGQRGIISRCLHGRGYSVLN